MKKYWVVVESNLDGFMLHQEIGDIATVFSLSSAQEKPEKRMHEYIKNKPGLICLDNDDAGHDAARWWIERYPLSRIWVTKEKDPGEDYQAGVNITAWLKDGLSKLPNINDEAGSTAQTTSPSGYEPSKIKKAYNTKNLRKTENIVDNNRKQQEIVNKRSSNRVTRNNSSASTSKACVHNKYCVSLKNGVCLISKEKPYSSMKCPKNYWYTYVTGSVTEIILGPGVKK